MTLKNHEENFNLYEMALPFAKGIYFYHFEILSGGERKFIVQNELLSGEISDNLTTSFAQVVTKNEKNNVTNGIIYQIFVDRFCKSGPVRTREPFVKRNDWGGELEKNTRDRVLLNQEVFCGNLKGITSKLSYLKNLGISIIYLSPIFLANSYHKYDTASYLQIDPMFGSEKDFKNLIEEGKKYGIEIVLDGVFNHTGSDSLYFNKESRFDEVGAYNSRSSKYFDWFKFSLWPDKYECWWGVPTLPAVNNECESFCDFIAGNDGVIEKWMRYGIKGFRLDVVDELSNSFLEKIARKIRSMNKKAYIIGEVWEDASIKIAYEKRRQYFVENQLDSVMDYPLKNGILSYVLTRDEKQLVKNMNMLLDHYPVTVLQNLMNIIGTHDSKRFWSVLGEVSDDENEKFKLFNPTIFYGDERGVEGGEAPLCRVCFPWEKDKTETEKWLKFLGKIRKNKVFKTSDFKVLHAEDGVIVIERKNKNEKLIFITNLSGNDFSISIDKGKDLINNIDVHDSIIIPDMEVGILKLTGEEE